MERLRKVKQKLLKKEKSTFLKDPVESLLVHAGKILDKNSLIDIANMGCMLGLGAFNMVIHDDQLDYLGAFDFFIGASTWAALTTPHKSEAVGIWGVANMTAISLATLLKQLRGFNKTEKEISDQLELAKAKIQSNLLSQYGIDTFIHQVGMNVGLLP